MSTLGGTGLGPFSTSNPPTGNDSVPEVQITVGTVPIEDTSAQYINDGPDIGVWVDYQINNRYEQDRHVYMMPVASPTGFAGGSAAFVQLAAPTLLWICDWTAARWFQPPIAPSPIPIDPNWVLLDEHAEPVSIVLAENGTTVLYRLSGTFVFGHKAPDDLIFRNIAFGRPPYYPDTFQRTYPSEILQTGLIDTLGITAGGGGSVGAGAGGSFGGVTEGGTGGAGGGFG